MSQSYSFQEWMRMTPPTPRPLPAEYKKLCPQSDRSHAEEMAHWVKDPTLVQGMFCAFIFQDALCLGICGEDVVADLAEIENYRWRSSKPGWMSIMLH